jgi:FADH2 O2-dependent halogenase
MWGISRRRLDDSLLEFARESGVQILQPARCECIESNRIVLRELESNRIIKLDARWILIANGKGAATSDLGVKSHFTGVDGPRDAIELFGVDGHYGGLAPIEDGSWNASFSVPTRRVRQYRGDLDALFAAMVSENVTLRHRMRHARRSTAWLASPLPRSGVIASWPEYQIPIGNAAAALEPIGGEGIGLAMRSAEIAANELIAAHRDGRAIDTVGLRRAYQKLWRVRSLACRAAAMIISRPALADFLAGAIDGRGTLAGAILRCIGKENRERVSII